MANKYVLALDEGTSSARAILFDKAGRIVAIGQREFRQIYPSPGWVEHDPVEIWNVQLSVAREALATANARPDQIAAIGITNQRETCVVWDRATGLPIHSAIVWQDRRTAGKCDELKAQGLEPYVREATGLVIDAYFSGTKIAWILDNVPGARDRAEKGELAAGTIDSWLIWNLTEGKVHVTDFSNASRTMLFNIRDRAWDDKLLDAVRVPRPVLPAVRNSSEVYGKTAARLFDGVSIPVAAAIGDQHGALFGQSCFDSGMVKCTYGTGCSLLMNTGAKPMASRNNLLTTIAWSLDGEVEYALEGLIFTCGSVVQWLRDEMQLIHNSADSEHAAAQVRDTNGVYFVPAFTGLSAPYWDQYARGTLVGITRGTNRNHIIRAALESMAFQIRDVIGCMEADSGIALSELKVDGGAVLNNFLMQFQADLVGADVLRPQVVDTTAKGAAYLAGLATGFWPDKQALAGAFTLDRRFTPAMGREQADRLYAGWTRAVQRARDWEQH